MSRLVYLTGYAESEIAAQQIAEQAVTYDVDHERDLALAALMDILTTSIAAIEKMPETPGKHAAVQHLTDRVKDLERG